MSKFFQHKMISIRRTSPLDELYTRMDISPGIRVLSDRELALIIDWEREMFLEVGTLLKEHEVTAQLNKTLSMFDVDLANVDTEYFKLRESTVHIDQKIIDDLEPRAVERHNTILRAYFPWSLETMRNTLTVINCLGGYLRRKNYMRLSSVLINMTDYFSKYSRLCVVYDDMTMVDRAQLAEDITRTSIHELGLLSAYKHFLEAHKRRLF